MAGVVVGCRALAVHGATSWNCYELSWLTPSGKPEVAAAEFRRSESSARRIVEIQSPSSCYLNSFNQTCGFRVAPKVLHTLESDLSVTALGPVMCACFQHEPSCIK